MARIKHVVTNPYTLWGNQQYAQFGVTENYARNSSGNCSFDGIKAYSYSAIIGKIITNSKGEKLYARSSRTWSVTTTRHQLELTLAIPNGMFTLSFPNLGGQYSCTGLAYTISGSEHTENFTYFWTKYKESKGKAERSRAYKVVHQRNAIRFLLNSRAYAEFFNLNNKGYGLIPTLELVNAETEILKEYE